MTERPYTIEALKAKIILFTDINPSQFKDWNTLYDFVHSSMRDDQKENITRLLFEYYSRITPLMSKPPEHRRKRFINEKNNRPEDQSKNQQIP